MNVIKRALRLIVERYRRWIPSIPFVLTTASLLIGLVYFGRVAVWDAGKCMTCDSRWQIVFLTIVESSFTLFAIFPELLLGLLLYFLLRTRYVDKSKIGHRFLFYALITEVPFIVNVFLVQIIFAKYFQKSWDAIPYIIVYCAFVLIYFIYNHRRWNESSFAGQLKNGVLFPIKYSFVERQFCFSIALYVFCFGLMECFAFDRDSFLAVPFYMIYSAIWSVPYLIISIFFFAILRLLVRLLPKISCRFCLIPFYIAYSMIPAMIVYLFNKKMFADVALYNLTENSIQNEWLFLKVYSVSVAVLSVVLFAVSRFRSR